MASGPRGCAALGRVSGHRHSFVSSRSSTHDRPIAIDAKAAFGRPVLAERGITTATIAERIDSWRIEVLFPSDTAPGTRRTRHSGCGWSRGGR
ncbi:MAG: hypothetical protein DYH17_06480 [Xanthomonadales bacterium PRO6]|nr:hypothetical protein [Xanthomonadales bacterium PRO6]